MRIIFSRKGFDSGSGGTPSPIFPDGRMVSLPIPHEASPIHYADIKWHEYSLGTLVSDLTSGRVSGSHQAHLDPDLRSDGLPRLAEWKPLFGQTGIAQGHLRNNGVKCGDIFLFFGLFRDVIDVAGKLEWKRGSLRRHVLWGWLQIDEVLHVDECDKTKYVWAQYHPHFHRGLARNNTVYIAREHLRLPGPSGRQISGAGVFPCFSEQLRLTAPSTTTTSLWELPEWFYPCNGKSPLTYHGDMTRWERIERGTRLRTVSKGQEFILDCADYPEAIEWLKMLLGNTT